MEVTLIQDKVNEAKHFLSQIRVMQQPSFSGDPSIIRYPYSALLNAAYSVNEYLEREARENMQRAGDPKQVADRKYKNWHTAWERNLSPEDRKVWDQMEKARRTETHKRRARLEAKMKALPIEMLPGFTRQSPYYGLHSFGVPGPLTSDPWAGKKKALGLPAWTQAWIEIREGQIIVDGDMKSLTDSCERYVSLLERLVTDCKSTFR